MEDNSTPTPQDGLLISRERITAARDRAEQSPTDDQDGSD